MKLLLTSGGVTNASIHGALTGLLDKPLAECRALCIPTAEWGHPWCTPESAWRFVAGRSPAPMTDLGWGSVGLLELTALPGISPERWQPWVQAADVLLVDGGDAAYLAHWLHESGLLALLPSLPNLVWVGVSAGSMALTPRIGPEFMGWRPPGVDDRTLGLVDFSIFPHLGHPDMPANTLDAAERWAAGLRAAGMTGPCYALDDQSALVVTDGTVTVVSEGRWTRLTP